MAQTTFDLSVLFKIINNTSNPLKEIKRSFDLAAVGIARASSKLQTFGNGMSSIGQSLSLRLGAPLLLLGRHVTKTALDFESAFTGVRKTVDATEFELRQLEAGFKALSTEIPISAVALFGIGEAAGQLGIQTKNILGFSKVMADLGATTNLQGDEAAKALARLANITGMPQDQFDRLGATIVDLGNNLATTEAEIVHMALRLAGAGKVAGMTEAEILSFSGALSSIGVEAEAGGTAFSRVMIEMQKAVALGTKSKHLKGFAKVSGKTVKDFSKDWNENASFAVLDFIEGLKRMEDEVQGNSIKALDKLKLDGARLARVLLGASGAGDKFRKATELGNKAWLENVALTKEANLRYRTAASRLIIFKNKVALLADSFGKALLPKIAEFTKMLEPMIEKMKSWDDGTKNLVTTIGTLAVALTFMMIPLGMMITSFGKVGSFIAKLWGPIKVATVFLLGFGAVVWGTFALFAILIASAIYAYTEWGTISKFWGDVISSVWQNLINIFQRAWDIITKVTDAMGKAGKSILSLPSKIIDSVLKVEGGADSSFANESKTDINIKVSTDQNSSAKIEGVKSQGGANINVIHDIFLGNPAMMFGGI